MLKKISNIGDCGISCDFGDEVNKKTSKEVIKLFNFIQESINSKKIKGILNYTPSYNKLIINFELGQTKSKEIIEFIKGSDYSKTTLSQKSKVVEIPICYDEEFALDIKRLEEKLKMKEEKIYESFFEKEFFCYMTGFIAGMPFLGDLDENLRAKRLDTPRVKVPKGSIGLTEQFANIYTFESPGGWNIIGNTPLNIFDSTKEKEPNLINPGDLVTFKRISKEKYQNYYE